MILQGFIVCDLSMSSNGLLQNGEPCVHWRFQTVEPLLLFRVVGSQLSQGIEVCERSLGRSLEHIDLFAVALKKNSSSHPSFGKMRAKRFAGLEYIARM